MDLHKIKENGQPYLEVIYSQGRKSIYIPYRGLFSLGLYFRCKAKALKLIPLKFLLATIQILWRVAPNTKISTHEKLKSDSHEKTHYTVYRYSLTFAAISLD